MMRQYFEDGYKVVCESMFGDLVIADLDDVEVYGSDSVLDRVDEEAKIAYFCDSQDYDD